MRYLLVLYLVLLYVSMARAEERYHWPMQADRALTSTFGEYRGGRLHAAIDLKTWGKEGFPVFAVADGYVERVRTSPWGYGRAVYVILNDGHIGVWAHLSGFSERIESYVMAEQDRRSTYSVNLFFRPDQLPVKRGEVLGFSGSTGIGVPHLHFELRDANQRPINPLLHGFDVADSLSPTPVAVGMVPQDDQARIDGVSAAKIFALTWQEKQKRFVFPDTVVIWGRVGLALDVFDRADASALTNKMAPYRLSLQVDDREVFASTYDMFSYDVTQHGDLDRNFLLGQRGWGRFHNLFCEVGNRLPFYGSFRAGDGVLWAGSAVPDVGVGLSIGVHHLKIETSDAKGNRSEAGMVVKVDRSPVVVDLKTQWLDQTVAVDVEITDGQQAIFEHSTNGGKTWQPVEDWVSVGDGRLLRTLPRINGAIYRLRAQNAYGLSAFCTFAPPEPGGLKMNWTTEFFPTFAVVRLILNRIPDRGVLATMRFGGHRTMVLPLRQVDLSTYEGIVPFDLSASEDVVVTGMVDGVEQQVTLVQQVVTPKEGGVFGSRDGAVQVRFAEGGVYDTFVGRVERDDGIRDVRMIGSAYEIMPQDVAFEKATLAFVYPESFAHSDKLGIYERRGTRWIFVDKGKNPVKPVVTGEVKHLGVYALMVDLTPPEIVQIVPKKGQTISERRPVVVVTVRDAMSGIWREEDYEIFLNDVRLIVEYDPEENRMIAQPRQALSPDTHRLNIRVRDICGNEVRQTSNFVVK